MTADQAPVGDAGCFLCGRPGTARLKNTSSGAHRFECPACGCYEIQTVVHEDLEEVQQPTTGSDFVKPTKPVEMETAAVDLWTKALETAERERRSPRRNQESQPRPTDVNASACA